MFFWSFSFLGILEGDVTRYILENPITPREINVRTPQSDLWQRRTADTQFRVCKRGEIKDAVERKLISVSGVELGSDIPSTFALQEAYEEEMKRDTKKRYCSSPMVFHLPNWNSFLHLVSNLGNSLSWGHCDKDVKMCRIRTGFHCELESSMQRKILPYPSWHNAVGAMCLWHWPSLMSYSTGH